MGKNSNGGVYRKAVVSVELKKKAPVDIEKVQCLEGIFCSSSADNVDADWLPHSYCIG
jgi:hypothetical protein